MTKVGITGHQRIPSEALDYITAGIMECLTSLPEPIIGYSSLAIGADQLFAQAVLDTNGELLAVLPCVEYEATFAPENLKLYRTLLSAAVGREILGFEEPSESAFMAAGQEVIKCSDILIAVWDGKPAAGLGGTADAVAYAKSLGKPVVTIWPEGIDR